MAFDSIRRSSWLRHRLGMTEVRREKLRMGSHRFLEILASIAKHRMGGVGLAILVFFAFIAIAAPYLPIPGPDVSTPLKLADPSWAHPFGTDFNGKDILSRVIWGSRISLLVGLTASVIAAVLGTLVGLAAGYWGGWKDEALMRVNDVFLSLPWLVLLIVVAAILGNLGLGVIIFAIGITSWNSTARVVRAQVLSVKERAFVERARSAGAGEWQILRKHIFPNVFPLVFANTILTVAVAILSESTLAYLGKTDPRNLSWGVILQEASSHSAVLIGKWGWIVMPGLALVFVILGFSLLGYALDEVLNPKLRER